MASFNEALGPLFFISLCKNICYLMLQSVATTFSTVTCAAHQAMWSVWAICSFCPTPLEQAAQVLLPRHVREDTARAIKEAATPNAQKGDPASMPPGFVASREFVKCLALVGVATGMLLGTITAVVARHPHWLTPDTALYGIMASFTPYMMASLVMAGICIFLDGVLQAVGDLQYLCKSQAINVLALWLCLYGYVKQSGVGIIGVWYGVVLFFFLRVAANSARVLRASGILGSKRLVPKVVDTED
eukprot:Tamp_19281.p1 GENE.Tamp_19281~~Tamp_19281.p1  ORF type:complete len:267 (+),score=42.53 Tamp_19281:68-802(+)